MATQSVNRSIAKSFFDELQVDLSLVPQDFQPTLHTEYNAMLDRQVVVFSWTQYQVDEHGNRLVVGLDSLQERLASFVGFPASRSGD